MEDHIDLSNICQNKKEGYVALSTICQGKEEYIEYFKRASNLTPADKRIELYFPTEFRCQSTSKIFLLKLKSIKQPYLTDDQYLLPAGIIRGKETQKILDMTKETTKETTKDNFINFIKNLNIEMKPNIEDARYIFSSESPHKKKDIMFLLNFAQILYQKSKLPDFNKPLEILHMAEMLSEITMKITQEKSKFYENDFDCTEVISACPIDQLYMPSGWSFLGEYNKYVSKKDLYILRKDILSVNHPIAVRVENSFESLLDAKDKGKNKEKNIALLEFGIKKLMENHTSIELINPKKLASMFQAALKQGQYTDSFRAKERMKHKGSMTEKGDVLKSYVKGTNPLTFYKRYFSKIKMETLQRLHKQKSNNFSPDFPPIEKFFNEDRQ